MATSVIARWSATLSGQRPQPLVPLRPAQGVGGAQFLAGGPLGGAADGRAANDLLQRPVAAAGAPQRAAAQDEVADLAGGVVEAAAEAAVDDDPGPHAGAQGQEDVAVHRPRRPAPALAQGGGVGVLVDPDGHVEGAGDHVAQGHVGPADQVAGAPDAAGVAHDLTRHGEPDGP
jgi:hypothetical protein